jgi:hypothetical protein
MRHYIKKLTLLSLGLVMVSAYAGGSNAGTPLNSLIQPGFYGLVDIGDGTPPPVVYPQPVLIAPPAESKPLAPVYFHVPPSHAKDWKKHCSQYKACAQPVYFVRSGEYLRDEHYSSHEYQHDYENFRYAGGNGNKNL